MSSTGHSLYEYMATEQKKKLLNKWFPWLKLARNTNMVLQQEKKISKIQSSQNKGKETSYILPDTTYLCLNKCFNEINPIFNTNRNLHIPFYTNVVKTFCGPSSSIS